MKEPPHDVMISEEYDSQDLDYLDFLNTKLKDFRGFKTMAFELIQNADDAGAEWIEFDFRDDSLVVSNSAVFRFCAEVGANVCEWIKNEKQNYPCDYHRFRRVAGGGKKKEDGSIGNFGIGFISVYGYTDEPEVRSGSFSWSVNPARDSKERIRRRTSSTETHKTVVSLPWAKDGRSPVRSRLGGTVVSPTDISSYISELIPVLEPSLLFLEKLKEVRVLKNGVLIASAQKSNSTKSNRVKMTGTQLNSKDGYDHEWLLLSGRFDTQATLLRKKYNQTDETIENKRRSTVTLAFLSSENCKLDGSIFAFLPTDVSTGLPFHLNADFYPTSERKQIILAGGSYEQEWNEAALSCASEVLCNASKTLPKALGHNKFFQLLDQVYQLRQHNHFGQFWSSIEANLKESEVVYTVNERWKVPSNTVLRHVDSKERRIAKVYTFLELEPVHEDLKAYRNILLALKAKPIDCELFVKLLTAGIPNDKQDSKDWVNLLKDKFLRQSIYEELTELYEPRKSGQGLLERIRALNIGIGNDGKSHKLADLHLAPVKTRQLFSAIDPTILFANELEMFGTKTEQRWLVPEFTAEAALNHLSKRRFQLKDMDTINRLHVWFLEQQDQLYTRTDLRDKYCALPIFPADGVLKPLRGLLLPSGLNQFSFALKGVITMSGLDQRLRSLWENLGTEQLDWPTQVRMLANYLNSNQPSMQILVQVLSDLSSNLKHFAKDKTAMDFLRMCKCIPCKDGISRTPGEVYFETEITSGLLGNSVSYLSNLVDPADRQLADFLQNNLRVNKTPKPSAIIKYIRELVSRNQPTKQALVEIKKVLEHVTGIWSTCEKEDFIELRSLAWLPASNELLNKHVRWCVPSKVSLANRKILFASQAEFLVWDMGLPNEFVRFLGLSAEPSYAQVVDHLNWCVANDRKDCVDISIYKFLDDFIDQGKSILDRELADTACLILQSGDGTLSWNRGKDLFWVQHHFGKWRKSLPESLKKLADLLNVLGVKSEPTEDDFIEVLLDIGARIGGTNSPLEDEDLAVVRYCLATLNTRFLERGGLLGSLERLKDKRVIPNEKQKRLRSAKGLYFGDKSRLIERCGDLLINDVIPKRRENMELLEKLGVKSLSKVVSRRLMLAEKSVEDSFLTKRMRDRIPLIRRIIEPDKVHDPENWRESILSSIVVYRAAKLQEVLEITELKRQTEVQSVDSFFDAEKSRVYLSSKNEVGMYASLAKELLFAMNSEASPSLRSPVMGVLQANSTQEARQLLDELEFDDVQEGEEIIVATCTETVSMPGVELIDLPSTQDDESENNNTVVIEAEDDEGSFHAPQVETANKSKSAHLPTQLNSEIYDNREQRDDQAGSTPDDGGGTGISKHGKVRTFSTGEQSGPAQPKVFAGGLQNRFARDQRRLDADPMIDAISSGPIKNMERYREKTRELIRCARVEEPPKETRFSWRPTKVWDEKNSYVRIFLSEQYKSEDAQNPGVLCQICNYGFKTAVGHHYFEAPYLVPYTHAKWIDHPGNAICLCANCCAKFQYGSLVCATGDILATVQQLDANDPEPQWVPIVLCGHPTGIKFTQRHIVMLQELLNIDLDT